MFIHIFGFRWKPEATEGDRDRAHREILAFRGVIAGLTDVKAGVNVSPRGQGYEFAGLMTFVDRAACEAYGTHPAHLKLLEWLLPLIDPIEMDFEAP